MNYVIEFLRVSCKAITDKLINFQEVLRKDLVYTTMLGSTSDFDSFSLVLIGLQNLIVFRLSTGTGVSTLNG